MSKACEVRDCTRKHKARGFCGTHYARLVRYGLDPHKKTVAELAAVPEDLFWSYVDKDGPMPDFTDPLVRVTEADGNCWVWTGNFESGGYGRMGVGGKSHKAHRLSLEYSGIPLRHDLTIDHLCRNKPCVRPDHLEQVPSGVNVLRSNNIAARNKRKTHCKRNHELTADNIYVKRNGGRQCKKCNRLYETEED